MSTKLLSVIIPAYNETDMIPITSDTVSRLLDDAHIPYELLFIDDGSTDDTWAHILTASARNPHIRGIHFSRNFGKESAMFAGLSYALGDCAVIIDCDLQHPPQKIIEMYRLWEQGYDIVQGVKENRTQESPLHTLLARTFYKIISKAVRIDMSNASDFKLLDRKVITALLSMKERSGFFRALSSWVGFRTISVPFRVQERTHGTSKWSPTALFKYALTNISAFSTAPMQIVTILGILMFLASLIFGAIALYQKIIGVALDGFTTVILLQLFTGSIIMISLGIIGYYIARIYDEIKQRPRYIVSETCGEPHA